MKLNKTYIKTIILLLGLMLPMGLQAQKKEISAAKANLKTVKSLEAQNRMADALRTLGGIEQSMRTLLADSANRYNTTIWDIMSTSIRKQYAIGNEMLYLKQPYDTAQIFLLAGKLFQAYEEFDVIDATPDKKGVVRPKMRKKHAQELLHYKKNIYNGGNYFLKKQRYQEACQMFETYYSTTSHDLFVHNPEEKEDTLMPRVAYMVLYTAYKSKQYDKVEQFYQEACADTANLSNTITWMAEVRNEQHNEPEYVALLQKGFELFPTNRYFISNLFSYYLAFDDVNDANKMVDRLLSIDAQNRTYRFAKTAVLLYQERFDECIKICNQLIEEDESDSSPYLNAGLAYYRSAEPFLKSKVNSQFNRQKGQELYKAALPYLQFFREKRPDSADLWATPLYHIYLNLNMGKEFEEIEELIRNNPEVVHEHD